APDRRGNDAREPSGEKLRTFFCTTVNHSRYSHREPAFTCTFSRPRHQPGGRRDGQGILLRNRPCAFPAVTPPRARIPLPHSPSCRGTPASPTPTAASSSR